MNILLLRDINNDHDELIKTLKTFEKPVVILNDMQLCISFLSNSSHQINNRQSILIVLNRVGRQIVPEIHSLVNLSFIVIFCTKKDNKIKWTGKYNKIKGIYINSEELVKCVRHLMKKSNLLRSYPCQLVFLDEHLNEMMRQQLYRLDSSLIVFKRIHLCLDYILSAAQERFLILITVNALGRQIVPEIHDNNQLKAVFIFCNMNSEKIKWTTKYNKIKVVTNDIAELIQCVRNEGFYHSTLPWHLVCLDDRCDELLRDRMHELDPCVQTFNQFSICERYLTSFHKDTNAKKSILFITTNRIGRQFIPEIHTNNKIQAFYIFIPSDSAHDRRTRWTKKYNKIKCVCTDLDQLVTYIKQDTNEYLVNNIDVHQSVSHVPTTTSEIGNEIIMHIA
ncbi:hypothetical protein I4U23_015567 [Adineta vaga]|nr:hypothetical protein I4U23_015567 [Adineta vaga]